MAPPVTFQIDGVQYISILTGNGGGDLFSGEPLPPVATPASLTYGNYGRLLTFKLGGTAKLPTPVVVDKTIPEQQLAEVGDADLAQGERLYNTYCGLCHGLIVRSGGAIADLRRMSTGSHDLFDQIVLEGLLSANGMAAFDDVLSAEEVGRIHHYVRARAHEDREVALGNKEVPRMTWLQ